MAKVLEGPGMGLLSKWGMTVPHYVVITAADQLDRLAQANPWLRESKLVVKAHEAIGSRMKLGLVKVGLDLAAARKAAEEMLGKTISGMTISQVIISELIVHKEEFYLAVKSTREGADLLLAGIGGIEIESNWDKIKRISIPLGVDPTREQMEALAKEAGFKKDLVSKVADFAVKLYQCYEQEDGTYIEINPLAQATYTLPPHFDQ